MTDKGRILPFPDTAAIEAEAAAWVARFDAGEVSARDQAAFQEWLNRSQFHRECIAEYGSLWSEFDGLRSLANGGDAGRGTKTGAIRPALLKWARPWLAASAAAAIAVAGGMVFVHPKPTQLAKSETHPPVKTALVVPKPVELAKAESPAPLFYETAVGSRKKITLDDGTSVILNTNSRLNVDFSANRRDVHLVRGEAYFDVVHDKTRPFTVYANKYVVRDIGTAFDVHLSKAGLVEVGVTRGRVEVAPANGGDLAGVEKSLEILAAGHDIVLGQKVERPEAVSNADMGRKLAWRQGELIYTGQPLGDVVADISRYSDIKIELADPALETMPVGGAFKADQIQAIVAALENNFGLHAEWVNPQYVRFTSSRQKPASGE
jgi:transmembrane sensor